MTTRGPAPKPCASCPYRRDVPSGVWHPDEYAKLRRYDEDTSQQPAGLFICHQTDAEHDARRVCAGWVGCHGDQLLGLRLAAISGAMTQEDILACFNYRSPVPLFDTGADAAEHGTRDALSPSVAAVNAGRKIIRRRRDITRD